MRGRLAGSFLNPWIFGGFGGSARFAGLERVFRQCRTLALELRLKGCWRAVWARS